MIGRTENHIRGRRAQDEAPNFLGKKRDRSFVCQIKTNMKNLIFIPALLALTGCSGGAFTALAPGDPAAADGGGFDSKISAGGGEDDGGVLPTGSGGAGTGGAVGAVGTGGALAAAGGLVGSGGAPGSGGRGKETGGSSSGGSRATGGATGIGGATSTAVVCLFPLGDGTTEKIVCNTANPWFCAGAQTYSCEQQGQCTSGMPCGSSEKYPKSYGTVGTCTLVTHDNGLGQTWQDCSPLGTYNDLGQSIAACHASGAVTCTGDKVECNSNQGMICGYDASNIVIGCWATSGVDAGRAKTNDDSCSPFTATWR